MMGPERPVRVDAKRPGVKSLPGGQVSFRQGDWTQLVIAGHQESAGVSALRRYTVAALFRPAIHARLTLLLGGGTISAPRRIEKVCTCRGKVQPNPSRRF
jgi:hypothetical protein